MALISAFLVLILSTSLSSCYVLSNDEEPTIVWPTEYYFEGETLDFLTSVKKSFKIWYSAERNRSREDYFDGSAINYYYADYGYMYSVFAKTDSNMEPSVGCWKLNYTYDTPYDFLPPIYESLAYTGKRMILFDKLVDEWVAETSYNGILTRRETLYVYKTPNKVDIPVQFISKFYNPMTGSLIGYTITNYFNFKDTVAKQDLIKKVRFCVVPKKDEEIKEVEELVPGQLDIVFESYTNYHGKEYKGHERHMRKRIFEENYRKIQEHNSKGLSYKMALNAFADWTPYELEYLTPTTRSKGVPKEAMPFPHTLEEIQEIASELPKELDLRMEGVITQVKNQGQCGSCWAFAAVATVEGALARANGARLLDLSEQSLVDCAWSEGAQGCDGVKELSMAWKYVMRSGIPTDREYGIYRETDGVCHVANMSEVYKIKGFAQVTPRNSEALKVALNRYGPVNVAIQTSNDMFYYSNGLFFDPNCDPDKPNKNHAVVVVGYGNRNGDDYWIVKNSWGEVFGEDGYILMSAVNNNCFVTDEAFYAVV